MSQLDSWDRSLGLDKISNPPESFTVPIGPYAQIPGRNSARRRNRGCFHNHQGSSAHRPAADMDEVPFFRHSILAAILTHGGDKNPIFELYFPQFQRCEELYQFSPSFTNPLLFFYHTLGIKGAQ
jgi:hypothetical protein